MVKSPGIFDSSNWKTRRRRYDVAESRIGRVLAVRMAPGDDLFGTTLKICREKGVKAGVILSAAGSLQKAVLRNVWKYPNPFPVTDGCRMFTPVNGPLELLQMSGNVTRTEQGEPFLHAHVTISLGRPEATCYGGHLVEGCTVFTTCELMIAELENIALMRLMDKHTRAGELYGVSLDDKPPARVKKEIARRKARPRPAGTK